MKVAIFFGSKSDTEKMKKAAEVLKEFGVEYKAFVISAHRAGELLHKTVKQCEADGFEVLGPVAPPPVHGQVAPGVARALVRAPLSRGRALANMLGVRLRDRSARREEPVRVELDPTRLW